MPDLICWNPVYVESILTWKSIEFKKIGDLFRLPDYESHAMIIDINSVFSSDPRYEPVDRTLQTQAPYRTHVTRPWQVPKQQWTLDLALQRRADQLITTGKKINVFWSGGIDSTTAVTALLQNVPDLSQLRILYSPYSTYEHPGYLDFLKKFSKVEIIDISGERYLTDQFDGIFVTGDSGDELNASIDQSFYEQHGFEGLQTPWKDFFYKKFANHSFIDFCEQHFAASKRPIETVLEARWWFYATCKQRSILNLRLPWFFNHNDFVPEDLVGFFDCEAYEKYVYWNVSAVIDKKGYQTWKQPLKDYCFAFDSMHEWHVNKSKTHSNQLSSYLAKKTALNDHRWIAVLTDGKRIQTPSLPVLTRLELYSAHAEFLDRIFNEPNKV